MDPAKAQAIDAWTVRLGDVLADMTGSQATIEQIPFDETEARERTLWWRASGVPAIAIGVSETDAASLLRMRRDSSAGSPDSARSALCDIFQRSWGTGETSTQTPADPASWEVYQAEFASGGSVRFFVAHAGAVQAGASQSGAAARGVSNLDMLMDIELPVTIRFGSTQMALRDIAGLNAGSVIEFDRGVDEPVDVMVNGHVVARGEAVVVQGAYGIRILDISSRRERLLTSSAATSRLRMATTGEQTA
jgi:flagellar motor switch protein FliN/FliY